MRAGIDEALALREQLGEGLLGGERDAVEIEGFDVGASPREFVEPRDEPLIFSTTNGTRAILAAAERAETILLGSLLNLSAVAQAAESGEDVVVLSKLEHRRVRRRLLAGRIRAAHRRRARRRGKAAVLAAEAYPNAMDKASSGTYGPPGLEEDIAFVARVDALETVPGLARIVRPGADRCLLEA